MPEPQYQSAISSRDWGRQKYLRPEHGLHKTNSIYNTYGAMAGKSYNDDTERKPGATYGKDPNLAFGGRVAKGSGVCVNAMLLLPQTPTKKPRGKESSRHFGVRYRPDLSKWVAEIRVAEWKSVDKKVWLGTFDSEEGAARAVDSARKILRCGKKRPFNFPCPQLEVYRESIPAYLDLTDLANDVMYKDVTNFIKKKAQEYASIFCPNMAGMSKHSASSQLMDHHGNVQAVDDRVSTPKGTLNSPATSWITHVKVDVDELHGKSCPTSISLSPTGGLHHTCHQDSTLICYGDDDGLLFGDPDLCSGSDSLTIEDSDYCREDAAAAGDAHGHLHMFQRQNDYNTHDDLGSPGTCSNSPWPGNAAAGYGHHSRIIDIHSRTSMLSTTHVVMYDAPMQLDTVDSAAWASQYLDTCRADDSISNTAEYTSYYNDEELMSEILGSFDNSSGDSCSPGPNESTAVYQVQQDPAFMEPAHMSAINWPNPSTSAPASTLMYYNGQDHMWPHDDIPVVPFSCPANFSSGNNLFCNFLQ